MKLFDPIFDVVRYIKMYQIYLGFRMYLICSRHSCLFSRGDWNYHVTTSSSIFRWGNDLKNSEGIINQSIYKLINFLGLTDSILSILLLICVAFVLKGVVTFFHMDLQLFLWENY